MREAVVRPLAKINLDLRVLGKRADGFHELRTVFQTISLSDRLVVRCAPASRTAVTLSDTASIADNLAVKAAHAVLQAAGRRARVEMELRKTIPMGAGLGGGSSDAAAVLLALPVLLGAGLRLETLLELAESLGSDVPFFLLGGTAAAIGRGTEIFPLPDAASRHGIVAAPGVHVSTPQAYRALRRGPVAELTNAANTSDTRSFQSFAWGLLRPEGGEAEAPGVNDFESVVFRQYPLLQQIRGRLRKLGASPARMSGSGSALFGLFPSPEQAELALEELRRRPLPQGQVFAVRTVGRAAYRRMWRRWLKPHVKEGPAGRESQWPPRSRYSK